MKDEIIAKMTADRYIAEHPVNIHTEDAIKMGESSLTFEQCGISDNRVKLFLPVEFSDMSESMIKVKYPSSMRLYSQIQVFRILARIPYYRSLAWIST
jgi:hypothetical protein